MPTLLLRVFPITIWFFAMLVGPHVLASDQVNLDAKTESLRIIYHSTMLADPQRKYSTSAILRGDLDREFQPVTTQSGRLPVNGAWFKFTLHNETNRSLQKILNFETTMMREARLYKAPRAEAEHSITSSQGGIEIFPIELNSFAIETYYLFLDAPLPDYSLSIVEPLHHVRDIVNQARTSHLFYGASLGIFLYALILLATTRLPSYLWFASSVLTYTLTWATRDGSALEYFPDPGMNVRDGLPWIFLILSCISFAKFFSEFLDLKDQWPGANNVTNGFVAIWLGVLPLDFFVQTNYVVEVLSSISFVFVIFQLSILIPLAMQRQRDAIFYLYGYSVTLCVFAIIFATQIGLLNLSGSALLNSIETTGLHLGQFVWMIVMTFALGDRFRELSDKQQEATRESQSKSSFLANMSHEIRTPMNGVLGMTELLNNTEMNSQQKTYVSTIYSSASALLKILDDILDYSKIQSGKLELERLRIDLYQFVADTVLVFAAMSRDKKVPLVINIDENLPAEIWGDPTRLRQILVNLLGNAFKFTSEGYIAVNLYRRGGDLVMSIRDTGVGISAEDQHHIFATFSQADISTNRKFGGSGLGLSICKDLLGVMGGSISVTSEPGIGSDFIVRCPIESMGEKTFLDNIPSEIRLLSALVYEPIESKRNSIVRILQGWGIAVKSATTIEDARHIMGSDANLRFVLTNMPATLTDLKGCTGKGPKLIQLATVSSNREKSAGVDCVIEEPVSPGNLLNALQELFCEEFLVKAGPSAEPVNPRPSHLQVLVAEDNEINQRVICGLLNKLGVEPVVANNGNEAFRHFCDRQAGEQPFHLILMDCEMPQVDGYEATRLIRDHESINGSHVDIVALTANVLPEHRKKAQEMGMDEFLTKPVRLAELQHLLSNLQQSPRM